MYQNFFTNTVCDAAYKKQVAILRSVINKRIDFTAFYGDLTLAAI